MKREELVYVLSKIEPNRELKEQTKLKMMNAVMAQELEKEKSPNFFKRVSGAVCTAAVALVCITTFGVQKFVPNSYVAEINDTAGLTMVCEENVPSRLAEQPSTFTVQTRESDFCDFLAELTEDYRAIGVDGEIVSKETFICNDENEYGIYGFAILNVKISDMFFSENEPFFGIKNGDTVSFIKYISSDEEMEAIADEGSFASLYAYSGKDLAPIDNTSKMLGIDNAFVIFK